MVIIKVLKRKDAASVIVAVTIAMILGQFLTLVTTELAGKISGIEGPQSHDFAGPGWQITYLLPFVTAILQLVVLEVLIRVYSVVKDAFGKK